MHTKLVGKSERKKHSEDLGVAERIILEWMSGKYGGKARNAFVWLGMGTSGRIM
jgi:hypothetical protein